MTDDENAWPVTSVDFCLRVGVDVEAQMDFSGFGPQALEPARWLALLGPAPADITLCTINGGVRIATNGTHITFYTSRYGGGGNGDIRVKLPVVVCREAIEQVAAELARVCAGMPVQSRADMQKKWVALSQED